MALGQLGVMSEAPATRGSPGPRALRQRGLTAAPLKAMCSRSVKQQSRQSSLGVDRETSVRRWWGNGE